MGRMSSDGDSATETLCLKKLWPTDFHSKNVLFKITLNYIKKIYYNSFKRPITARLLLQEIVMFLEYWLNCTVRHVEIWFPCQ